MADPTSHWRAGEERKWAERGNLTVRTRLTLFIVKKGNETLWPDHVCLKQEGGSGHHQDPSVSEPSFPHFTDWMSLVVFYGEMPIVSKANYHTPNKKSAVLQIVKSTIQPIHTRTDMNKSFS